MGTRARAARGGNALPNTRGSRVAPAAPIRILSHAPSRPCPRLLLVGPPPVGGKLGDVVEAVRWQVKAVDLPLTSKREVADRLAAAALLVPTRLSKAFGLAMYVKKMYTQPRKNEVVFPELLAVLYQALVNCAYVVHLPELLGGLNDNALMAMRTEMLRALGAVEGDTLTWHPPGKATTKSVPRDAVKPMEHYSRDWEELGEKEFAALLNAARAVDLRKYFGDLVALHHKRMRAQSLAQPSSQKKKNARGLGVKSSRPNPSWIRTRPRSMLTSGWWRRRAWWT